jgi:hypothetical protein
MHHSFFSSNKLNKRSYIESGSATHVLFYCKAGCHQFVQPCHAIKPCIKYQYNFSRSISTADADDFSMPDCLLLLIHLAATSIAKAATDASTTPARLILTTHSITTIATATTANNSNTTAFMLITIQFTTPKGTTTTADESSTTSYLSINLSFAMTTVTLATATMLLPLT